MKVFSIDTIPDEPTEATRRQIRFLTSFLFDKSATDQNWNDSMHACLAVFCKAAMQSENPAETFETAIELLKHGVKKARRQ